MRPSDRTRRFARASGGTSVAAVLQATLLVAGCSKAPAPAASRDAGGTSVDSGTPRADSSSPAMVDSASPPPVRDGSPDEGGGQVDGASADGNVAPEGGASCVSYTQIVNGQPWPNVCLFDPSSPLHRPLPDNPQQLMANQAQMIATLYPGTTTGNALQVIFDTNLADCAQNCDVGSPTYLASSTDPTVTFSGMSCGEDVNDSTFCTGGVGQAISAPGHIPAVAGIEPASDSHFTVIQPDGTTYDGWGCGPKSHTWADGDTVACNTLAVTNVASGSGLENDSPNSGNSSVVSPARVSELEGGFDRMVRIQTACVNGNVVFPGTSQAEVCTGTSSAPPIGARIQVIDTPAAIDQMNLTTMEKNLLIAGHTYGWVIWDTYGGSPLGVAFDLESAIQYTSFGAQPPMKQLVQQTAGWAQNDPANDSWVFQGDSWAPFADGWAAHLRIVDPCYSALTNPCTQ